MAIGRDDAAMPTEFLQQPGQRDDTEPTAGVILLAAGFSRRFGGVKLNALLPSGLSVFAQTFARIRAATPHLLIVTREALLEDILAAGAPREQIVLCNDAHKGMGHTLACGIAHVPRWHAALVCLADMPFVETSTYSLLLNALHKNALLVPEYKEQRGNPVGFGARWFPALATATGDTGGRELMKAHPEAIERIAVDDPAIHWDVDVPGDLEQHGD